MVRFEHGFETVNNNNNEGTRTIKSVLITGGSGYLGQALTRRFLLLGFTRICIFSRDEHKQARMRAEFNDDPRLRFFIGDVRDRDRLIRAMAGVELVVHAAALKRIEVGAYAPDEVVKTNVLGTMEAIEAAFQAHVDRFIYVSTDKAVEPISPYGQTKAVAESLVLRANEYAQGPDFRVVRYGNIAGATGSVIPKWREAIANDKPLIVTDLMATRFWMTIEEAVDLVEHAATSEDVPCDNSVFIPENQRAYQLRDLYLAMADGIPYVLTGLPPHEKLHEKLAINLSSADARHMTVSELREALAHV